MTGKLPDWPADLDERAAEDMRRIDFIRTGRPQGSCNTFSARSPKRIELDQRAAEMREHYGNHHGKPGKLPKHSQ